MSKNTYSKQQLLQIYLSYFYKFACCIVLMLGLSNFARAQDDSQLFSSDQHLSMVEGDIYRFQIAYKNTGTTTWSAEQGYVLASPQNIWGAGPISIKPGEPIPPGGEFRTHVTVTAPRCCNARLDWQMRKGRDGWFGSTAFWEKGNDSTGIFIQIYRKPRTPHRASFHSDEVPMQMVGGQTYTISVTMKNTGTATWTEDGKYHLGSILSPNSAVWGVSRIPVQGSVGPGRLHTFKFDVTAPSKPGIHKMHWRMLQTGVEWFGNRTFPLDINVSAPEPNSASFVTQTVPESMVTGQQYVATVTMKNTGTLTWTEGDRYRLGSYNPQDNINWQASRVYLTEPVAPGQSHTFNIPVNAPNVAGVYQFQWQMVQDGVEWFGAPSANVAVSVDAPIPNNAHFVSQSVPDNMVAGRQYDASVTLRNTGTATWSEAAHYRLGSQGPQDNANWGPSRVFLSKAVAPGESYTFDFPITAPATPGSATFQWQMVQDGVQWFGNKSTELHIPLSDPVPHSAAFVSQRVPDNMLAGQQYSASVTMRNTGSATWTEADSFRLGSHNPQDNAVWGPSRIFLSEAVAPGQLYTFTFPITAPATPNTYDFQWQMVQDGVTWFGAKSANLRLVVSAVPGSNNAVFVAQNIPASMIAGQTHTALVTMRNTGTTTWTAAGNYQLGARNPVNNTIWTSGPIALVGTVPPGQEYTFSFPITAPAEPASYNFQWQMAQAGKGFGAESTNAVVQVAASTGEDGASFVSQNLPVTTMTAGQSYTVSVTMKNTGSSTWTAEDGYYLGAQNPQDPVNTTWVGTGLVSLDAAVAAGEEHTFSFPVVAPATPGTYNFQWKMLRKDVAWFGAQTTNIAVPVIAATITETITFFHNDVSGSPMLATDASGNLLWNESYLPYGERLNDIGDGGNALWFTGKPHDSDTGLSYMGARYYNPALGRFMGIDPVGFDADNLHSFNRYAYANNNPHRYVDPDGRASVVAFVGVLLFSGGASYALAPPDRQQDMRDSVGRLGRAFSNIFNSESKSSNEGEIADSPKGDRNKGSSDGERAGKSFTPKGKREIDAENAGRHNGQNVCEECGQEVVPGKQSKSKVTPPGNQRERDHIIPRSKGGNGDPSNGQILCRTCNSIKSDK